jgi:hypothetical protein
MVGVCVGVTICQTFGASGFCGLLVTFGGYPCGLGWWSVSDRLGLVRGVLTLLGMYEKILLSSRANVSDDRE